MLEEKDKSTIKARRRFFIELKNVFWKDKIFLAMLLIFLMKSIVFIGLLGTETANGFNFGKAFVSIPAILLMASFCAIILSVAFLFSGRGRLWAFIVLDILYTVLIVGDLWYYRGFTEFLNFFLLSETSNLDHLGGTVKSMTRPIDLIFMIDIVIFVFYAIFNRELYRGVKRNVSIFVLTLVLSVGYISYFHYKVDTQKKMFLR